MTTIAHVAFSYILSQIPAAFGRPLSSAETIAVIAAGNVADIDSLLFPIIYPLKKKLPDHHAFVTHTTIGAILMWFLFIFFITPTLPNFADFMILLSLIFHLILDDSSFWFYKLGWQKASSFPQINWLYPSKKRFRVNGEKNPGDIKSILSLYSKARVNLILELLFIITAIALFLAMKQWNNGYFKYIVW